MSAPVSNPASPPATSAAAAPPKSKGLPILSPEGMVIEYIPDRLYLGAYSEEPTDSTPFPFYHKEVKKASATNHRRSPSKLASYRSSVITKTKPQQPPIYFSVDDDLVYNRFHHDFGPLHVGHLYRFAVHLHDFLGEEAYLGRNIVFYSKPDPKSRANAACLLACYMVLIQSWPPHLALAPLAQANPPFMPFRDAGYSTADFMLGIQDIVYGVWRAKEKGMLDLRDFDLEEYERYERVDQGDFNWVSPEFIAFASPIYPTPPKNSQGQKINVAAQWGEDFYRNFTPPNGLGFPKTKAQLKLTKLTEPFRNVLKHFIDRDVGLVVRLNSHLYPAQYFESLGMKHMDMIFDDGTCPPLSLLRKFINIAHDMITVKKRKIAVHCKAGLGRTGCLIGAYLIYKYGFTANECIAYMRFMRPGMVVGPQQHWLHLHQQDIRAWWHEDRYLEEKQSMMAQIQFLQQMQHTPSKKSRPALRESNSNGATPPPRRSILGEIGTNDLDGVDYQASLPAPTPGQPRKTVSRFQQSSRHYAHEDENRKSGGFINIAADSDAELSLEAENFSDEEIHLQMLSTAKRSASKSPSSDKKRRSVSYTITTTTSTATVTSTTPPSVPKSGNGLTTGKVRQSPRRNNTVSGSAKDGVRKVSGRIGSASHGALSRIQ